MSQLNEIREETRAAVGRAKATSRPNWDSFFRWQEPTSVDSSVAAELARELAIPLETASVLLRRSHGDREAARMRWAADFPIPDLLGLPAMGDAVAAIASRITAGGSSGRIAVYSDFDADGVTGAVILKEAFTICGAKGVEVYFPSRFEEGYGFHPGAVRRLAGEGVSLIVTADCGITGFSGCDAARDAGCEVVITDHHRAGDRVPEARAVLDPQLPSWAPYDLRYLSGAGVAYLLARALFLVMGINDVPENWAHDLLTLSIAGDGQPVIGLNRMWVRSGLKTIVQTPGPGIKALLTVSGMLKLPNGSQPQDCHSNHVLTFERDVMFGLVPRINAAGRLAHANLAYELLTEKDFSKALERAGELDLLNSRRREIEEKILAECLEDLRKPREDLKGMRQLQDAGWDLDEGQGADPASCRYAICAYRPSWHEGVIGIASSKVKEIYFRPSLLVGGEGEVLKGSARGIPGFNVHAALSRCRDLLVNFGGHEGAGGFSVRKEKMLEFFQRFEEVSREMVSEVNLIPSIRLDAVVPVPSLDDDTLFSLLEMEPFGEENPVPMLASYGCEVRYAGLFGRSLDHLELHLAWGEKGDSRRFLWFGQGKRARDVALWGECDVVFTPCRDLYGGEVRISLVIKDIRLAWGSLGTTYDKVIEDLPDTGPLILYTWSRQASRSIYVSLLRRGRKAALHERGWRGALAHEARLILKGGGIVVSTGPWDIFQDDADESLCGGRPRSDMRTARLVMVHPPLTEVDWQRLRRLGDTIGVEKYPPSMLEDAMKWLSVSYPQKEYMEKAWKFLREHAVKNALFPWEIGQRWKDLLIEVDPGADKAGAALCRERGLVLLESCLTILEELDMVTSESRKTPLVLLREPRGKVSLSGSPSFVRGKKIVDTAKKTWAKYHLL
ncbi:MAG: DHH family phosphoesterase [Candidatus Fermentithermobacillus carboniphilus]|uniref:Single-stranded-DNA-specific exonuclease RecJ n=1 Tax=Candidatus Fermentithermobacillus carboniphilus TaxID=3085328 RepID=A0AAT9LBB8_9FIRM|nr:MAG: DHH family phosphoesterase [Candidatus Fermentithermobacillus carboniphilus]